jgi:GTP cyclohydrolase IB
MTEPKYLRNDIQEHTEGFHKIKLDAVGVRELVAPIKIKRKDGTVYSTNTKVSAYCKLDADQKGVNMSRNSRTIFEHLPAGEFELHNLDKLVLELAKAHDETDVKLKFKFTYLFADPSPVTKIDGFEPVDVKVTVHYINGKVRTYFDIVDVESSCCPCSKNMSMLLNNITDEQHEVLKDLPEELYAKVKEAGFGAHNQRSNINVTVELNSLSEDVLWIEDIVEMVQRSVSSPIHNILKRPDEKVVTELQYMGGYFDDDMVFQKVEGAGPAFSEDICRNVAAKLIDELDNRIVDFSVVVDNEESIHTTLFATSICNAGRELH